MPSGFSYCPRMGNKLYKSPPSKDFTYLSLTSRNYVPLSGDLTPVHQDLMPVHQDFTPVCQDLTPVYQDSMPVCQYSTPVYQDSGVLRGSVVKCLTRNPGVLGSSLTRSSGFFRGSVFGQDTSEPQNSTGEIQERH